MAPPTALGKARARMGDFADIDRSADPKFLVGYLDTVSAMPWFQAYKRRTFALLDVHEGDCVLEIGCGTGEDAQELAQLVGDSGRVVAVDNSETVIGEARARGASSSPPVDFRVGDAHRLDFAEGSFDGCRADRVFQHLSDPSRALGEMVRVARTGARIVVFEPDWETLVVDAPNRAVTRRILNQHCDGNRSGWIGRQLPALFKELQLVGVDVVTETLMLDSYPEADRIFELSASAERAQEGGTISAANASDWLEYLKKADLAGRFFSAITAFLVWGRKP